MTNLRLPGQYDERLFQRAGIDLPGPYYNWNRWYLPPLGRYMELDPLAMAGQFNGGYTPDGYNYAEGNPVSYTDPLGLDRYESCNNEKLSWLGKWLCKKAIKKTCAQLYGREHCCNADRDDCRNQKQPGCDGWDEHMKKCEAEWAKCNAGE